MKKEELDNLENKMLQRLSKINKKIEIQDSVNKVLLGKVLGRLNSGVVKSLEEAEFRVFSQFGDDGIIQFLVDTLDIENKSFIEFGVENYNESNTRFLLENNHWRGLVIDGSRENVEYIRNTQNYWRYDLTAVERFVTAETINQDIESAGFKGKIGLLHIDIDGNDYWVWKALTVVEPVVVIVEYNSLFGDDRCITVPYKPDFYRFNAHYSGLYAGSSLPALYELGIHKGYAFVGCNSAGNNAYFVLKSHLKSINSVSCKEGFRLARFKEHRDEKGNLTYTPGLKAVECIRGMPVFNTLTNREELF